MVRSFAGRHLARPGNFFFGSFSAAVVALLACFLSVVTSFVSAVICLLSWDSLAEGRDVRGSPRVSQ